MNKANKLRKDYEKKLKVLQNKECKHPKLTDWMDYQWAIGHDTGYQVRWCVVCDKELHRRTSCWSCSKPIEDDEIITNRVFNYGGTSSHKITGPTIIGKEVFIQGPIGKECLQKAIEEAIKFDLEHNTEHFKKNATDEYNRRVKSAKLKEKLK